jgi:hypothetical protein
MTVSSFNFGFLFLAAAPLPSATYFLFLDQKKVCKEKIKLSA